ncbi:hypothetical protein [Caniella muris]|uniref:hypothetical protein n=1 Tax=Caniella muris TaxID=2941502 RepID=UPI002041D20E|nr:hypothetical protein [Caniella muris]
MLACTGAAVLGFAAGAAVAAVLARRAVAGERSELLARISALEEAVQETRLTGTVTGRHVATGEPRYRLRRTDAVTAVEAPAADAPVAQVPAPAPAAEPVSQAPAAEAPAPVEAPEGEPAAAPRPKGRHFKENVAAARAAAPAPEPVQAAPTPAPEPVQAAPAAKPAAAKPAAPSPAAAKPAAPLADRLPGFGVPDEERLFSAPTLGDAGLHTAAPVEDYESVAAQYAQRKSFKNRMMALSKGVGRVLAERLGGDIMDDLPMIQRADGTVADVGTSWWEAAAAMNDLEISRDLSNELASIQETVDDVAAAVDASISFEVPFSASDVPGRPAQTLDREDPAAPATAEGSAAATPATTPDAPAPAAAALEADSTDCMDLQGRSDGWEQALDALDQRFDDNLVSGKAEPTPAGVRCEVEPVAEFSRFQDFVGGDDTLDEPDGLEPDTQFLTFRAPAGHPEVTDTASYVNYLVAHEMGENRSRTARRAVKHALKVIPGGTSADLKVV